PANSKPPRLLVWATKDPAGAALQKIQIIKGWTAGGETHERVYDVICSDGIKPDPRTHKCADNGATVDPATCAFSANKGATDLRRTWQDLEFEQAELAFYYARVLENPTCRTSTWRAIAAKPPPPSDVPPFIHERAWSSPIWYTPKNP